ncbi:MAG: hypothetical protein ACPGVG_12335 [Mycobacterium sp.]
MKRPAIWKTATISAAIIGLNLLGAGAAMASPATAPHQSCNVNGASTSVCQSPGDASIVTAPNPDTSAQYTGPYGAGIVGGH